MRQGFSITGQSVMFLQHLLFLLAAIQVTFSCTCREFSWDEYMCSKNGKTVVYARIQSVKLQDLPGNEVDAKSLAYAGKYEMVAQQILRDGPNTLAINDKRTFVMIFPLHEHFCGRPFEEDISYLIAGDVKPDGIFYSNICELVLPEANIPSTRHRDDSKELYVNISAEEADSR